MLTRNLPFLLPTVIAAIALTFLVGAVLRPRWMHGDRDGAARLGAGILLIATLVLIASATFLIGNRLQGFDIYGRPVAIYSANTEPFASIRLELSNADSLTGLVNVVGNVLLFVPLGCFGLLCTRWRLLVVVLSGGALSLAIEATQYLAHRVADVDDVILNATGTVLGAMVGLGLQRMFLSQAQMPDPAARASFADRG